MDDSKGLATHLSPKFVWQALADWKTYAQAVNFMWYASTITDRSLFDVLLHSVFITGVAIALFTPTIVHDLGFSANNAQLLSIPPFLLGGISTYVASVWSDRLNLRGPFIAAGALVSMVGYIIAYTTSEPGPGYAAAIIAACGAFPSIAITLAWASGNAGGNMKRGIVLALVVGLGNIGACVFPFRRRGVGAHNSNVTSQHMLFIHLLSTAAFLQGTWHDDRLPRYEVCIFSVITREKTKSFCSLDG